MPRELEGKVALVTGAGQGLGAGISLALAKAGADVALVGRTRSKLEETAKGVAAAGGRYHIVHADVSERADVDAAVAEIADELGPVWALINNAVSSSHNLVEDVTDAELDESIRSGIYGSFYMMQACFPAMKTRGGRIVNFGSGAGTMGMATRMSYNIAKEGVRALAKTAATEWGRYGITVNTICPIASTPLYESWFTSLDDGEKQAFLDSIPMGRMGDAEQDVGALIVFLVGPGASYITGRTLHVDGGRAFYDR
jgi:NAD(P)-dependent dehydrogenase (short-subunit alcohol dehydrogenase family)